MSEKVARLAVNQLRNVMFPALPADVQKLFPKTTDALMSGTNQVPNIMVGSYQDLGANTGTPLITVYCDGAQEGIVNVYRHLDLHIDIWLGGDVAANMDGRRLVSTIYEYINRSLQNINWSGTVKPGAGYVSIQRCYETERSPILFEPTNKIYHLSNTYRVEAISQSWY